MSNKEPIVEVGVLQCVTEEGPTDMLFRFGCLACQDHVIYKK